MSKIIYFLKQPAKLRLTLIPIGTLLWCFFAFPIIAGTFQTITLQQNDAFRWDIMNYVQKEVDHDITLTSTSDNRKGKKAP